jgi:hypothetical protein
MQQIDIKYIFLKTYFIDIFFVTKNVTFLQKKPIMMMGFLKTLPKSTSV